MSGLALYTKIYKKKGDAMYEFLTVILIAVLSWLSGFFMTKHQAKEKGL